MTDTRIRKVIVIVSCYGFIDQHLIGTMALIEQRFSTLLLQWLERYGLGLNIKSILLTDLDNSNPSTAELLRRRKDLLSRTQRNGDVAFEKQVTWFL